MEETMYKYNKLDWLYSTTIDLLEELHIKTVCEEKSEMYRTVKEVFTNDIHEIIKISGLNENKVLRECSHTFIQPIYNYYKLTINLDPDKDRFIGAFPKALILECLLHMLCQKNFESWKQYGLQSCLYFNNIDYYHFTKAVLKYCSIKEFLDDKTIAQYYLDSKLFTEEKLCNKFISEKPWLK